MDASRRLANARALLVEARALLDNADGFLANVQPEHDDANKFENNGLPLLNNALFPLNMASVFLTNAPVSSVISQNHAPARLL